MQRIERLRLIYNMVDKEYQNLLDQKRVSRVQSLEKQCEVLNAKTKWLEARIEKLESANEM